MKGMYLPGWHFALAVSAALYAATGAAAADKAAGAGPGSAPTSACPALLNKTFKRLQDDAPQNLCQYQGRVLLVVNTASYCGFTNQYEGLEALHARLNPQGLVVLGFPSNDFSQEPGQNKEIADFCFNTFGVKFPMFEKSTVSGKGANPLYQELARAAGSPPRWNFYKYLVDRQGRVVGAYSSVTGPDNGKLLADIQKALAAR